MSDDDGYHAPRWTASWDPAVVDAMYQEMINMDGDTMGFEIRREAEDDRTFSADSIDEVLIAMRAFFYSRLTRAWGLGGAPHEAKISLTISLK